MFTEKVAVTFSSVNITFCILFGHGGENMRAVRENIWHLCERKPTKKSSLIIGNIARKKEKRQALTSVRSVKNFSVAGELSSGWFDESFCVDCSQIAYILKKKFSFISSDKEKKSLTQKKLLK